VVAAQRLEKIAREGHMVGNGFGDPFRIDELGRLADLAIGHINESDARIVEDLFELQRLFFRYCSMLLPYGSMPCSPSAAILLTAHTMSCCWPRWSWWSRKECPD